MTETLLRPNIAPVETEKRTFWPGLGRTETLLVAVCAVALLMVYNWLAYIWLDMIDEGYFLEQATRILRGQLPYRDFDTYYTPAVVYLHALTFWITGDLSVIPVRIVLAVVRTLIAVFLYLLARPIAPPPIAIIPVAIVLAVDPVPVMWEPHPGTYANLTTLVVFWSTAVFLERRQLWALAVAGVFSGITFAFKQNIGVFAVMSVCGFLALYERPRLPFWLLAMGRIVVALVLCLAFTGLLLPTLNRLYFDIFLLPLYAVCGLLVADSFRKSDRSVPVRQTIFQLATFLGTFALVTAIWIIPLARALGVRNTPWHLFIGRVNTAALIYPLIAPSPLFPAMVILLAAPLLTMALSKPYNRRTGALIGIFVLVTVAALRVPIIAPEPFRDDILNIPAIDVLNFLTVNVGNQVLYLPTLVFWPTLGILSWLVWRHGSQASARWRWYLFGGVIYMFAQFPRVDEIHLLHAALPLFVAATGAASVAWRLSAPWSLPRALVLSAIVALPVVSVSSTAAWRAVAFLVPDAAHPQTREYEQLGLERAPVLLPTHVSRAYRGIVQYIDARTSPGDPIFAFPVDPMFYFLADRPNPSRYNHLQPGVADEAAQRQIIDDLGDARYVIWNHLGVQDWDTREAYKTLNDHIWYCYTPREDFPPYVVMERNQNCR